jgi:hypothetical protein
LRGLGTVEVVVTIAPPPGIVRGTPVIAGFEVYPNPPRVTAAMRPKMIKTNNSPTSDEPRSAA